MVSLHSSSFGGFTSSLTSSISALANALTSFNACLHFSQFLDLSS